MVQRETLIALVEPCYFSTSTATQVPFSCVHDRGGMLRRMGFAEKKITIMNQFRANEINRLINSSFRPSLISSIFRLLGEVPVSN